MNAAFLIIYRYKNLPHNLLIASSCCGTNVISEVPWHSIKKAYFSSQLLINLAVWILLYYCCILLWWRSLRWYEPSEWRAAVSPPPAAVQITFLPTQLGWDDYGGSKEGKADYNQNTSRDSCRGSNDLLYVYKVDFIDSLLNLM